MRVSVKNLGPIREATVELGGLNVFVGPNGTGKSYLGKVLYGLHCSSSMGWTCITNSNRFQLDLFRKTDDPFSLNQLGKTYASTAEAYAKLQALPVATCRQAVADVVGSHGELFKEQLVEYFNDDSNLFKTTSINCALPADEALIANVFKNGFDLTMDEFSFDIFLLRIFRQFLGQDAHYFPAARSNFILTYKEIYAARAEQQVGNANLDRLLLHKEGDKLLRPGRFIRFDQPTEDFLKELYYLDTREQSEFQGIADKLQSTLYGQDRLLIEQVEGGLANFRYQVADSDRKLRLHLASSMVTETSPLLIGLRHWVGADSLMIIDEPESHLHPEAQRALVYGLAAAVNQGLRVVLITHSPYILSCVNNLVKFASLRQRFADDPALEELTAQHPELVALEKSVRAYHFGLDGWVKDIVQPDSGLIDEAEFTEPFDRINELYEAMRDIEWAHRP